MKNLHVGEFSFDLIIYFNVLNGIISSIDVGCRDWYSIVIETCTGFNFISVFTFYCPVAFWQLIGLITYYDDDDDDFINVLLKLDLFP